MPLAPEDTVIPVNEIRDYHLINVQVAQALDMGARRVRLTGVEGHRLLLAGLTGAWEAVVEVFGKAGPELALELDAPQVVVVAYGGAGDGAAASMRAGSLVALGDVGAAFGYRLDGGVAVATTTAGHRAGLEMADGTLILARPLGCLVGERQSGGRIYALAEWGPDAGRGQRGGKLLGCDTIPPSFDSADREHFRSIVSTLRPWLPPTIGRSSWPAPGPRAHRWVG